MSLQLCYPNPETKGICNSAMEYIPLKKMRRDPRFLPPTVAPHGGSGSRGDGVGSDADASSLPVVARTGASPRKAGRPAVAAAGAARTCPGSPRDYFTRPVGRCGDRPGSIAHLLLNRLTSPPPRLILPILS